MSLKIQLPLLLAGLSLLALSGDADADERPLEKKNAERLEVRHSMVGPRDTLLFYTFADRHAVLRLEIGNADDTFPVTGKVYLFSEETTKDALGKWLNNQHSDGLFPDVPEPVEVVNLPREVCTVTERKLMSEKAHPPTGATFQDYKVTVSVKDHQVKGKFDLKGFQDQAGVFLKVTKG